MPLERQESNYAELAAEVIGSQITVKVPDVLWSICAEFVYNDDAEISVTQMLLCTLIVAQTQIKCVFVACIVGMTGFIVLTDYDWPIRVKMSCPTLLCASTDLTKD